MPKELGEYVTLEVTLNDSMRTILKSAPILNDGVAGNVIRGAFEDTCDQINFPTMGGSQVFIRAGEVARILVVPSTKAEYEYWEGTTDERSKD